MTARPHVVAPVVECAVAAASGVPAVGGPDHERESPSASEGPSASAAASAPTRAAPTTSPDGAEHADAADDAAEGDPGGEARDQDAPRPLEEVRRRIQPTISRTLRRRFPLWSVRRDLRRDQAYLDRRDAASLAAAAPPPGEVVGVRCVWIMEVYLPSHVDALLEGLRRLGLDQPEVGSSFSPAEWIVRARAGEGHFGVANLPYLVPPSRRHSTGRRAALPDGVDSLFLTLVAPVTGVTVLVAQFRFDDATAEGVAHPLAAPFHTTARREGRVIAMPAGTHLRDEAVREYRAALRRRCARWLHDRLPGAYAAFGDATPPACEMLTTELGDPLGGRTPPQRGPDGAVTPVGRQDPPRIPEARGLGTEDYLSILGLRDDFDAWACVELPGLVLRVPRGDRWPAPDGHLVLAARVASFGARSVPGEDGPPTHGRVTRETWDLSETFAVFALARIVDEYETRVAAVRDRLGSVVLRSARRAVSQMQRVERDLAELARDARPLLRAVISAPEYVWKGQAATFLPVSEHDRDDPPFFTTVAQRLVWRAGRLLAAESEARETAQTMSSLVAASANLRVARTNLLLQVISVAFAVLAVLLAAVALPDGLKAIPRLWRGNTSPPAAGAPPARADGARPGAVR